jgi:hypothetical protein
LLVDFDDFCEDENRLDLLHALRDSNPEFRCTLFAIPAKGSPEFWDSVPEWCELAMHGWAHPNSREAEGWTYEQAHDVLARKPERFVEGWKSPGWQSSPFVYEALMDRDWWIADHWENAERLRPYQVTGFPDIKLRAHVIQPTYRETGDHWHGHIPNVCGNGIEETFDTLLARVRNADQFQVMSEVVK